MNEIITNFLSAEDQFMPQMHLRQPGFTYTKKKERIQKFNETGYSRYIYQNELDKGCFRRNMAYGDYKDIPRF